MNKSMDGNDLIMEKSITNKTSNSANGLEPKTFRLNGNNR